jgi:hypothetical protein
MSTNGSHPSKNESHVRQAMEINMNAWLEKAMACQEAMEANPEKMEPYPDMMQPIAVHEEVP